MKQLLRYVNPQGELPGIAGTKSGPLLVCCTAACVWDDLRSFNYDGYDVMAIADMMTYFPGPLAHGVSLHDDWMMSYAFQQFYRGSHANWPPMKTHSGISTKKNDWVKYVWPLHRDGGTSGLFGVLIGLLMGYDRIVVAGSPLDDGPHFWEPPWIKREFYGRPTILKEWERARDAVFDGRVKSLSGNTRELLGAP